MERYDTAHLLPGMTSGVRGMAQAAAACQPSVLFGESKEELPRSLTYPSRVFDMITAVCHTQGEKLLESAYVISRAVRNGKRVWLHWDQGHGCADDAFPGRNGVPDIFEITYDPQRAQKGDVLLVSHPMGGARETYDALSTKEMFIIGAPAPYAGDVADAEHIREESRHLKVHPHANIWMDTHIGSLGACVHIPGMPSPIGPVSGPLYMTLMWMMIADACRILSIEGKTASVWGDEPELSDHTTTWANLDNPLMYEYLAEVQRELELIGAELGDVRRIASMVADILLDGGSVYYYSSKERFGLAHEAVGRRGGFLFAQHLMGPKGDLQGTSKDGVIMGVLKPDDQADLEVLDQVRKRGMKVASIGPLTRNHELPQGRTLARESDAHVGSMCDTYGLFAIPGFDRKVCPTSGILVYTLNWVMSIEVIEKIQQRTGGNIPAVFFNGALRWGSSYNAQMRAMMEARGY